MASAFHFLTSPVASIPSSSPCLRNLFTVFPMPVALGGDAKVCSGANTLKTEWARSSLASCHGARWNIIILTTIDIIFNSLVTIT